MQGVTSPIVSARSIDPVARDTEIRLTPDAALWHAGATGSVTLRVQPPERADDLAFELTAPRAVQVLPRLAPGTTELTVAEIAAPSTFDLILTVRLASRADAEPIARLRVPAAVAAR